MIRRVIAITSLATLPLFAADEYDKVKADSVVYDVPTEWRIYAASGPVTTFTIQKQTLWFATESGVASMNMGKKGDEAKYSKLGSMPATDITCMTTDGAGNVWIGGRNGIAVKSGAEWAVYTNENGLPDLAVTAVAARGSTVWVGTENGAAVYQGGTWKAFTSGLPSNKVQCIAIDKNGAAWVGTDKGIGVYDGAKWTVHNMKKGMSWNDTKAIGIDPRNNTVWAAVGEKDVNSFDGKAWSTFMDIQAGITSIMVDTQSRIWFGSGTGLIKFNGDEWINDPKQLAIPVAQVSQMYRDDGGNLWYAMERGVLRFANPYPF